MGIRQHVAPLVTGHVQTRPTVSLKSTQREKSADASTLVAVAVAPGSALAAVVDVNGTWKLRRPLAQLPPLLFVSDHRATMVTPSRANCPSSATLKNPYANDAGVGPSPLVPALAPVTAI